MSRDSKTRYAKRGNQNFGAKSFLLRVITGLFSNLDHFVNLLTLKHQLQINTYWLTGCSAAAIQYHGKPSVTKKQSMNLAKLVFDVCKKKVDD